MNQDPGRAALVIRPAIDADVPLIVAFITELAEYERPSHEIVATRAGRRGAVRDQRADPED